MWIYGTYQPVDHLAWIHGERSEETNEAITEYSSRERCEYGSGSANFCVIVKLETAHHIVNCPITRNTTLTRCTAKLRTEVLPVEALEAIILATTC